MKTIFLIALFALTGGVLRAQTNAPAAAPRQPTQIDSDRAEFDVANHKAVYHGNVRVNDPQMKLQAELLTVDLPSAGGRVSHIVAETNVVIDATDEKGQKTHATGDKVVYTYNVTAGVTNEIITLSGHASAENSQMTMTGEPIVWNRATGNLNANQPHIVLKQNFDGMNAPTNHAATNKIVVPKTK